MRNSKHYLKVICRAGKSRAESGIYLLELIVAVFISSLLAAALADNMQQTLRLIDGGQNQVIAAAIAQELVDNARNTPYPTLYGYRGTYSNMMVNKTSGSETGSTPEPRPLMLDIADFNWSTDAINNKFTGSVAETIADAGIGTDANTGYPLALRITINITWTEARQNKSYVMSTIISEKGIHT